MLGKGKYDLECEHVRKMAGAAGVILIICDGNKGFGMSCHLPPGKDETLPELFRCLADLIEREHQEQAELAQDN